MTKLTPEANRAARAILKWSVRDVAEKAGISFTTVHRFEQTGVATDTTKAKIIAAYAAQGVEITNGDGTGARLRFFEVEPAELDGRWYVKTRWEYGAPVQLVTPDEARKAADEAERRGDRRLADAQRKAANDAERYSQGLTAERGSASR
jgi:transcriptional regulator with XRE-family HTH domain